MNTDTKTPQASTLFSKIRNAAGSISPDSVYGTGADAASREAVKHLIILSLAGEEENRAWILTKEESERLDLGKNAESWIHDMLLFYEPGKAVNGSHDSSVHGKNVTLQLYAFHTEGPTNPLVKFLDTITIGRWEPVIVLKEADKILSRLADTLTSLAEKDTADQLLRHEAQKPAWAEIGNCIYHILEAQDLETIFGTDDIRKIQENYAPEEADRKIRETWDRMQETKTITQIAEDIRYENRKKEQKNNAE